MTIIVQHIIFPKSNRFLHQRFSSKVPKHLKKCVGVSVVLEFANESDKLALATNNKDLQKPIGMLSLSFDNRKTTTLHVPLTLEPIIFDGCMDYDIEATLGKTCEISGHFLNNLSEQRIENLNIKLIYRLV
jgi:hypothetical protein